MTKIEIDRAKGIVEQIRAVPFMKRRRTWLLNRFEAVRLAAQATSVEEGFATVRYAVFLEGPGISLEMLSSDDEDRARSLYNDLKELLAVAKSRGKY